jgi:hypothetical protein
MTRTAFVAALAVLSYWALGGGLNEVQVYGAGPP